MRAHISVGCEDGLHTYVFISPCGQVIDADVPEESSHCGAPAAAGNGVLRTLVAADRPGEPVKGPKAVETGKAEIPSTYKGK